MSATSGSSANPGITVGEVRPFPGRPTDESVYCYPHRYRIDVRKTHMGGEQRHVWFWDDGRIEIEEWIPSPWAATVVQTFAARVRAERERMRSRVNKLCDPAYTPAPSSPGGSNG